MVNLITGPRGSGKTQQMIDLANEKVKTSSGNVVFIKRSSKDTYSVDFNIRVIKMADYPDILTLEEFVGFLYGMAAGNHDIEAVFIDSILKQANITLESLPTFIEKLNKISEDAKIEFIILECQHQTEHWQIRKQRQKNDARHAHGKQLSVILAQAPVIRRPSADCAWFLFFRFCFHQYEPPLSSRCRFR